MPNILIVGGNFDRAGGKPSKIVAEIASHTGWNVLNGGVLSELDRIVLEKLDALIWMPNIDNAEDKIIATLKRWAPHLLLVSSKRIVEKSYTDFDVIGRLLASHSNLGIAIRKTDRYSFALLDPLGNQFCYTTDLRELSGVLQTRIDFLLSLTRINSVSEDADPPAAPQMDKFIAIVRDYGDAFSRHVNAINPARFLGNAAARPSDRITRCCHGFPAIRGEAAYWISRRNVDKATLSATDFVAVANDTNRVRYFGSVKPSVDAPIQIRMFNHYPNVNYIVHGHVYLDSAPTTRSRIPCGCIEEFNEIFDLAPDASSSNFNINLRGHGCLILASDLDYLENQRQRLTSRPFPELFEG